MSVKLLEWEETLNEGLGALGPSSNSMDYVLQMEWSTWI